MCNRVAITLAVTLASCAVEPAPTRHEYCAHALAEASDWREITLRTCFPDDWRFCWDYACEGGPNAVNICLQAWVPAGGCEDFTYNERTMHVCTPREYPH